jgi:putative heme-binding domain-containing protein
MSRRSLPPLLLPVALLALFAGPPRPVLAQGDIKAQWIWFDEGDPLSNAPAETRYFRKAFEISRPVTEATLRLTADNSYRVWINGALVGQGNSWMQLDRYDVKKRLVPGKNVVAVEAHNEGGPAGLVVHLSYVPKGLKRLALASDGTWKSSRSAGPGWQKVGFDDGRWGKARALGPFGRTGPWNSVGAPVAGARRFNVPDGFKVEQAVKRPDDRGPFSLVNMTFDAKGRLLVSQEGGPILICTSPDKEGVLQEVRDYCKQVRNCQGMCWAGDALFLVGDGPQGTGLYRCRDRAGKDSIDEVTLLHRFNGGMGEHGPHAVVHGPDNMLYVVIGNHAFARIGPKAAPNPTKLAANSPLVRWPTGGMGPDQGRPKTTEDVLLPRLNDANGHAANILAPGGTIWRLDTNGKNMGLFSAGYRNQFDAAFSPAGEMFTFDSDMEWDEGLPWYRAVRVSHVTPGSDFVWRTGAANTPNYYLDSLPPLYETGRGSPVGVEVYDHHAFGPKYRGALLLADWSLGIIYAVHLKRSGATYKATVERFCTGTPMNVTDLAVGPDGAVYFTLGGRGTQGGVYRIVATSPAAAPPVAGEPAVLAIEQPLSAWSRARARASLAKDEKQFAALAKVAESKDHPADRRVRALALLRMHGKPSRVLLEKLAADPDADVRAQAVYLLGTYEGVVRLDVLLKAMRDDDAFVRRRACEALLRWGGVPLPERLWPLLGDDDIFVRTAARLVLQRINPAKWAPRLAKEKSDRIAYELIVALCKIHKADSYTNLIYDRLAKAAPAGAPALLDFARVVQLALIHAGKPPAAVKVIADRCERLFPHADPFVSRELAIVLTHLRRTGLTAGDTHAKLLDALLARRDRAQQIHYFYCLRFLTEGWTAEQKAALASWYESTRGWSGGSSYTPFLENIFRECLSAYDTADRRALLAKGEKMPQVARVVAQRALAERQAELLPALRALRARLEKAGPVPRGAELRSAVATATVRLALDTRGTAPFPDLIAGLRDGNPALLDDIYPALKKLDVKPKADDPAPYRAAIAASAKLGPKSRWKAVEVLRHWSGGREFGSDKGDWGPELRAWARWFNQAFPKEQPLAAPGDKPPESKYKFDELLVFLTKGEGRKGDVVRGRRMFEKAQCIKCHKFGKEGEGVGPDLTTLSSRFRRADTLESILFPSKVISDQYRSTTVVTKRGQSFTGLLADQGTSLSILLPDASRVTIKKADVEQRYASLVSVMPENLLDALSKEEIADLFAFLESGPKK